MADTREASTNLDDPAGFTRAAAAGEEIFHGGAAGTDLYLVQDGQVELLAAGDGRRLALVDVGGVFGEAFLDGKPHAVTARACTDVTLIRLDRATFDRVVAEAPQVPALVSRQLARRIADYERVLSTAAAAPAAPVAAAAPAAASAPAPVAESVQAPRGDAQLVEVTTGTEFSLADLSDAMVGRPDRATGFVPELDLTKLDVDRTLSRRHARLVRVGDAWCIREDTATRNGTFVNGERVATGVDVELHDGDAVQFGFVKTEFRWR